MAKIVIKKRVSLEFLGDDYKDAELVFRSIPLSAYDKLMDELPKSDPELIDLTQKQQTDSLTEEEKVRFAELTEKNKPENKKSLHMILKYLKEYFISGKFPNDEGVLENLDRENIDDLDQETAMVCFERLTGQASDPKVVKA